MAEGIYPDTDSTNHLATDSQQGSGFPTEVWQPPWRLLYIRHRVEVQLGTQPLLKPLPHREPNSES